jgi:hypothetical protein
VKKGEMRKYLLKTTICLFLLFSCLNISRIVSANDSLIYPQCPEIVVCGEQAVIPIEIINSPEISSFGMDIVFSPELIYERCEKEGCLTEDFQFFDCNVRSETEVRLGGLITTPLSEGSNGCLVNIIFKIDDECSGPFIISLANLVDGIEDIQTESCEMVIESNITTTTDSTTSTTGEVTTTVDSTTSSSTTTTKICPAKVSLEGNYSGVEKLRAFRDYFLFKHPLGQKYNALYYKHASEISGCLLSDSLLRSKSASIISKILPKIDALMSGNKTTIDPGLINEVVSFFDQLELRSSEILKRDLKKIRSDLTEGEMLNQLNSITASSDSN